MKDRLADLASLQEQLLRIVSYHAAPLFLAGAAMTAVMLMLFG